MPWALVRAGDSLIEGVLARDWRGNVGVSFDVFCFPFLTITLSSFLLYYSPAWAFGNRGFQERAAEGEI
jgi:hypothetical protein